MMRMRRITSSVKGWIWSANAQWRRQNKDKETTIFSLFARSHSGNYNSLLYFVQHFSYHMQGIKTRLIEFAEHREHMCCLFLTRFDLICLVTITFLYFEIWKVETLQTIYLCYWLTIDAIHNWKNVLFNIALTYYERR